MVSVEHDKNYTVIHDGMLLIKMTLKSSICFQHSFQNVSDTDNWHEQQSMKFWKLKRWWHHLQLTLNKY